MHALLNSAMHALLKHWRRIAVTLIPVAIALMHAVSEGNGLFHINVLQRLDDIIYDTRLRATMPKTLDDRIVIIDIDEKSLAEVGRWPWGRNKMAALTDELFDRQKIAILGFDIVFAEADASSGLKTLDALAANELRDNIGFTEKLQSLRGALDYDAAFAKSLQKRPIVLGYYFTSDRGGRTSGTLPAPVMSVESLQGKPDSLIVKNNLAMALTDSGGDLNEALQLAQAAAGKDTTNPAFSDALGLVYLKRKETANATQAFRSTVAKAPEAVEYRIQLASALLETGNKAAAKAELAAAAVRKPSAAEQAEIKALEAKLR